MSLDGAKLICLDANGTPGRVINAKGRKFTIGYYPSCDLALTDERALGVHCEIECDAFGRIRLINLSEQHPIVLNGREFTTTRMLLNGAKFKILDNEYTWQFTNNRSAEYEDISDKTPTKQIGIPEQPPWSCPDMKTTEVIPICNRLTVHNFAYCIKSDESMCIDENESEITQNDATKIASTSTGIHHDTSTVINDSRRSKTPEREDVALKLAETPKINLLDATQNKENTSTQKKQKLLSLCHQSDVVITSYSPRETGVRIEKSFTAILKPSSLAINTSVVPITPKSVYSTPKSVLSELNEDGNSRDYVDFATPSSSRKGHTRLVNANTSMHLIDFTTPSVLRPTLKSSVLSAKLTPHTTSTTLDVPNSAESVILIDSTDESSPSVIEVSDADTPKLPALKARTTPLRTPQSLMRRALLTSAKKQIASNKISASPLTPKNASARVGVQTPIRNTPGNTRRTLQMTNSAGRVNLPTSTTNVRFLSAQKASTNVSSTTPKTSTTTSAARKSMFVGSKRISPVALKNKLVAKARKSLCATPKTTNMTESTVRTPMSISKRQRTPVARSSTISAKKLLIKASAASTPVVTATTTTPVVKASTSTPLVKAATSTPLITAAKSTSVVLPATSIDDDEKVDELSRTFTIDDSHEGDKLSDKSTTSVLLTNPLLHDENSDEELLKKIDSVLNKSDELKASLANVSKIEEKPKDILKECVAEKSLDDSDVFIPETQAVVRERVFKNTDDKSTVSKSVDDDSMLASTVPLKESNIDEDIFADSETDFTNYALAAEEAENPEIEKICSSPASNTEKSNVEGDSDKQITINKTLELNTTSENKSNSSESTEIHRTALVNKTMQLPADDSDMEELGYEVLNIKSVEEQHIIVHQGDAIEHDKNETKTQEIKEISIVENIPVLEQETAVEVTNVQLESDAVVNKVQDEIQVAEKQIEHDEEILEYSQNVENIEAEIAVEDAENDEVEKIQDEIKTKEKELTAVDEIIVTEVTKGIQNVENLNQDNTTVIGESNEIGTPIADEFAVEELDLEEVKQKDTVVELSGDKVKTPDERINETLFAAHTRMPRRSVRRASMSKTPRKNVEHITSNEINQTLEKPIEEVLDVAEVSSDTVEHNIIRRSVRRASMSAAAKLESIVAIGTPRQKTKELTEESIDDSALDLEKLSQLKTSRRNTRRASLSNTNPVKPELLSVKPITRRASVSAVEQVENVTFTPKRIIRRRSQLTTESDGTPPVHHSKTSTLLDETVGDMGVIVEEADTEVVESVLEKNIPNDNIAKDIDQDSEEKLNEVHNKNNIYPGTSKSILIEENICAELGASNATKSEESASIKQYSHDHLVVEDENHCQALNAEEIASDDQPIIEPNKSDESSNKENPSISDEDYALEVETTVNENVNEITSKLPSTPQTQKCETKINQTMDDDIENKIDFHGMRELLKTPRRCSTPHFKGMREMLQTPKQSLSPNLCGIKSMLHTPGQKPDTPKRNARVMVGNVTLEDEGLDKFFKTPRAKNLMVPNDPASAVLMHNSITDNVEQKHKTVYDLNATNSESMHLDKIFETPMSSRFAELLKQGDQGDDDEDDFVIEEKIEKKSTTSKSKFDSPAKIAETSITNPGIGEYILPSAEEKFDQLLGLSTSIKTPVQKVYERKTLKNFAQASPFSQNDIISDLPKTDVQEWVDSLEDVPPEDDTLSAALAVDDTENEVSFSVDEVSQAIDPLMNSKTIDEPSLSKIEATIDCDLTKNVTCETSEQMMNISTAMSSKCDPLTSTTYKSRIDQRLPFESLAEEVDSEISGLQLLDETTESVMEPLIVSCSESVSNVTLEADNANTSEPEIDDLQTSVHKQMENEEILKSGPSKVIEIADDSDDNDENEMQQLILSKTTIVADQDSNDNSTAVHLEHKPEATDTGDHVESQETTSTSITATVENTKDENVNEELLVSEVSNAGTHINSTRNETTVDILDNSEIVHIFDDEIPTVERELQQELELSKELPEQINESKIESNTGQIANDETVEILADKDENILKTNSTEVNDNSKIERHNATDEIAETCEVSEVIDDDNDDEQSIVSQSSSQPSSSTAMQVKIVDIVEIDDEDVPELNVKQPDRIVIPNEDSNSVNEFSKAEETNAEEIFEVEEVLEEVVKIREDLNTNNADHNNEQLIETSNNQSLIQILTCEEEDPQCKKEMESLVYQNEENFEIIEEEKSEEMDPVNIGKAEEPPIATKDSEDNSADVLTTTAEHIHSVQLETDQQISETEAANKPSVITDHEEQEKEENCKIVEAITEPNIQILEGTIDKAEIELTSEVEDNEAALLEPNENVTQPSELTIECDKVNFTELQEIQKEIKSAGVEASTSVVTSIEMQENSVSDLAVEEVSETHKDDKESTSKICDSVNQNETFPSLLIEDDSNQEKLTKSPIDDEFETHTEHTVNSSQICDESYFATDKENAETSNKIKESISKSDEDDSSEEKVLKCTIGEEIVEISSDGTETTDSRDTQQDIEIKYEEKQVDPLQGKQEISSVSTNRKSREIKEFIDESPVTCTVSSLDISTVKGATKLEKGKMDVIEISSDESSETKEEVTVLASFPMKASGSNMIDVEYDDEVSDFKIVQNENEEEEQHKGCKQISTESEEQPIECRKLSTEFDELSEKSEKQPIESDLSTRTEEIHSESEEQPAESDEQLIKSKIVSTDNKEECIDSEEEIIEPAKISADPEALLKESEELITESEEQAIELPKLSTEPEELHRESEEVSAEIEEISKNAESEQAKELEKVSIHITDDVLCVQTKAESSNEEGVETKVQTIEIEKCKEIEVETQIKSLQESKDKNKEIERSINLEIKSSEVEDETNEDLLDECKERIHTVEKEICKSILNSPEVENIASSENKTEPVLKNIEEIEIATAKKTRIQRRKSSSDLEVIEERCAIRKKRKPSEDIELITTGDLKIINEEVMTSTSESVTCMNLSIKDMETIQANEAVEIPNEKPRRRNRKKSEQIEEPTMLVRSKDFENKEPSDKKPQRLARKPSVAEDVTGGISLRKLRKASRNENISDELQTHLEVINETPAELKNFSESEKPRSRKRKPSIAEEVPAEGRSLRKLRNASEKDNSVMDDKALSKFELQSVNRGSAAEKETLEVITEASTVETSEEGKSEHETVETNTKKTRNRRRKSIPINEHKTEMGKAEADHIDKREETRAQEAILIISENEDNVGEASQVLSVDQKSLKTKREIHQTLVDGVENQRGTRRGRNQTTKSIEVENETQEEPEAPLNDDKTDKSSKTRRRVRKHSTVEVVDQVMAEVSPESVDEAKLKTKPVRKTRRGAIIKKAHSAEENNTETELASTTVADSTEATGIDSQAKKPLRRGRRVSTDKNKVESNNIIHDNEKLQESVNNGPKDEKHTEVDNTPQTSTESEVNKTPDKPIVKTRRRAVRKVSPSKETPQNESKPKRRGGRKQVKAVTTESEIENPKITDVNPEATIPVVVEAQEVLVDANETTPKKREGRNLPRRNYDETSDDETPNIANADRTRRVRRMAKTKPETEREVTQEQPQNQVHAERVEEPIVAVPVVAAAEPTTPTTTVTSTEEDNTPSKREVRNVPRRNYDETSDEEKIRALGRSKRARKPTTKALLAEEQRAATPKRQRLHQLAATTPLTEEVHTPTRSRTRRVKPATTSAITAQDEPTHKKLTPSPCSTSSKKDTPEIPPMTPTTSIEEPEIPENSNKKKPTARARAAKRKNKTEETETLASDAAVEEPPTKKTPPKRGGNRKAAAAATAKKHFVEETQTSDTTNEEVGAQALIPEPVPITKTTRIRARKQATGHVEAEATDTPLAEEDNTQKKTKATRGANAKTAAIISQKIDEPQTHEDEEVKATTSRARNPRTRKVHFEATEELQAQEATTAKPATKRATRARH